MSRFGETVLMPKQWSHLEFYVIPNIVQVQGGNFLDYPKFETLAMVMSKLFERYFTTEIIISNTKFKGMAKAWGRNKDTFITEITSPMFEALLITEDEKAAAEALVDAFNRHPWRAAFFISAFTNVTHEVKPYQNWDKNFFSEFYANASKLKGYSEKVIACFLQQGFLNREAIPIDTWIETFYKYALGIDTKEQFIEDFSGLGQLERVIWLASQSNKTNMRDFFDVLWCQRYGTTGNKTLREINPIACYNCKLKHSCVGLKKQEKSIVKLINDSDVAPDLLTFDIKTKFVCTLEDGVPRKCYAKKGSGPKACVVLIDEFSGYLLSSKDKLPAEFIEKGTLTFEAFILLSS